LQLGASICLNASRGSLIQHQLERKAAALSHHTDTVPASACRARHAYAAHAAKSSGRHPNKVILGIKLAAIISIQLSSM
jgi:hypothetical protein